MAVQGKLFLDTPALRVLTDSLHLCCAVHWTYIPVHIVRTLITCDGQLLYNRVFIQFKPHEICRFPLSTPAPSSSLQKLPDNFHNAPENGAVMRTQFR